MQTLKVARLVTFLRKFTWVTIIVATFACGNKKNLVMLRNKSRWLMKHGKSHIFTMKKRLTVGMIEHDTQRA